MVLVKAICISSKLASKIEKIAFWSLFWPICLFSGFWKSILAACKKFWHKLFYMGLIHAYSLLTPKQFFVRDKLKILFSFPQLLWFWRFFRFQNFQKLIISSEVEKLQKFWSCELQNNFCLPKIFFRQIHQKLKKLFNSSEESAFPPPGLFDLT